jgi:hypothetical protein
MTVGNKTFSINVASLPDPLKTTSESQQNLINRTRCDTIINKSYFIVLVSTVYDIMTHGCNTMDILTSEI